MDERGSAAVTPAAAGRRRPTAAALPKR